MVTQQAGIAAWRSNENHSTIQPIYSNQRSLLLIRLPASQHLEFQRPLINISLPTIYNANDPTKLLLRSNPPWRTLSFREERKEKKRKKRKDRRAWGTDWKNRLNSQRWIKKGGELENPCLIRNVLWAHLCNSFHHNKEWAAHILQAAPTISYWADLVTGLTAKDYYFSAGPIIG